MGHNEQWLYKITFYIFYEDVIVDTVYCITVFFVRTISKNSCSVIVHIRTFVFYCEKSGCFKVINTE